MPTMADITVKAANGTTDVVLKAKTPSFGDKSDAVWTIDASSTIRNHRATFTSQTLWNGPKTARRAIARASWPVVRMVEGVETIVHRCEGSQNVLVPQGLTDSEVAEFVHVYGNFLVSNLIREVQKSGYNV